VFASREGSWQRTVLARGARRRAVLVLAAVAALAVLVAGCSYGEATEATNVTDTSATLHGYVVSDNETQKTYWFEYGTTSLFGTKTPDRTIPANTGSTHLVEEEVSDLEPDTTYRFRLCARDTEGQEHYGCLRFQRFTTDPAGSPPPTELSISADPALYPEFDPAVSDYVTRCANDPVYVRVAAPDGVTVSVDGGTARSGRFSTSVALKSGQRFDITTTLGQTTRAFHVRCLPSDFASWTYSRSGSATSALGFTLLNPVKVDSTYVAMLDTNAVPVWWYHASQGPLDSTLLSDDTVAFEVGSSGAFGNGPAAFETRRLDGTLVRWLSTTGSPTDFHDFEELPSGNYLMLSYKPRDHVDLSQYGGPDDATVLDGVVQEVTPNGAVTWTWNSKDHIALSETARWWPHVTSNPPKLPDGRTAYDIVHINGVEFDGYSLLISLRHTDAVYRIFRGTDGHVEWKLGGTQTPQSLTVVADPEDGRFGGQHDPRRVSDGTVSLHDNGTDRNRPPRAVRFSIDPDAKTATLVETVTEPDVTTSPCCGSARKLSSGGWLVDWGGFLGDTIAEYGANGSRISKLTFPGALTYRAFPIERGRLSIEQLRAGMDTMHPR